MSDHKEQNPVETLQSQGFKRTGNSELAHVFSMGQASAQYRPQTGMGTDFYRESDRQHIAIVAIGGKALENFYVVLGSVTPVETRVSASVKMDRFLAEVGTQDAVQYLLNAPPEPGVVATYPLGAIKCG